MQAETRTGPVVAADGTISPARGGKTGEVVVGDAHGRYREAVSRGAVFSGSVTGQVTTVGTAATYTGLVLSNPIGSGYNLSVLAVGYSFIVAFTAAAHVGLMTGFHASTNVVHTVVVTPLNQLIGGAAGVGRLDSSATLPIAGSVNSILASADTGLVTTAPVIPGGLVAIEGAIELAPGSYVAFYTSTASGAAGSAFSIGWEEIKN